MLYGIIYLANLFSEFYLANLFLKKIFSIKWHDRKLLRIKTIAVSAK